MEKTRRRIIKYSFAFVMLILGALINHFNLGAGNFYVYGSVGTYLIYLGFIGLIIATLTEIRRREKIVDERMQFIATKAMRTTFLCLIIIAFIIIIIDGLKPITMPYHLFMSYIVSGMLAIYYISYKILLRFY
ncbi:hypothetical protein AC481_06630 [miscellaneous Crenarchaeota group archaeon SMTZ-80]|nr:MAG: hypothetical protein AC481_06630 [miscellaneous Crenarchaeota group archaeon SMTZ-80]